MAVTIKLKNASGSDPNASDLVVGELAIRTDTAKLFTKKDNGSVVEILGSTGGGLTNGDKGDITVANNGDTLTIDNGVVTTSKIAQDAVDFTKLQNISTNVILGRNDAGTGITKQLSTSEVRTLINVEDGATADQTAAEIKTLLQSDKLTASEIADLAVGASQIASNAVYDSAIQSNAVSTSKIQDGAITNAKVNASAAIAGTKISPDFGSQNIATTGGLLIGDTSAMNANFGSGTHGVVEVAGSSGGELVLRRDDTSISSNNVLGRIEAMGNDPNGNEERIGGVIQFSCPNGRSWSADDYPTNITFATCKDGSGTRTTSLFLNAALGNKKHNVLVGGASGSNMDDYYLGIRGNENTSDGDSTNVVNFGILNQSQNASAQAHIDFRLGQASTSNTCGVRLIAGKMSGWNNTTSTRDGYFKLQVANNATLTTRLYINNAGRIGLGNIAPSEILDVTGNIAVSGTVDGVDIATRDTLFGGLTSSSGVLTNGVTATTQSAGDNSTKVATTAYTDTAISNLVDSSPSTLNTLNELAAALGDDANFSTTVTNSIATKMPLAGGTFTGNVLGSSGVNIKLDSNIGSNGSTAYASMAGYLEFTNDYSDAARGANKIRLQNDGNWIAGFGISANSHDIYTGGNFNFYKSNSTTSFTFLMGLSSSGNLSIAGTVDGRDVAADGTKLDGIESGATADQTASEIVSLLSDQNITTSGNITTTGDLTVGGTYPAINLYDSNNNPDWRIQNNNGMFAIFDQTNGANRVQINTDGHIDLLANVDISNGLDVTGAITATTNITANGDIFVSSTYPRIHLTDTNNNSDYLFVNDNGNFRIYDDTNSAARLSIDAGGTTNIAGNLDVGSGIDVTGAINGTGNLTITRPINTNNTLTLGGSGAYSTFIKLLCAGAGGTQIEASGRTDGGNKLEIKIGSNVVGFFDESDFSVKGDILLTGDATTTNQNRMIKFTGFDKEGTTDFTDNAFIRHTTNTGGLAGSVLEIGSLNDSNDGIAFHTNSHNNNLRLNGNIIWNAGNDGSGSGLDADKVDGIQASSFVRGDGVDNGATTIEVNDADFIVQDTTDSVTNFIWRDHSANKLYIGTAAHAVVTPRSSVVPQADSTYNLGANGTRWANIYADTLYGDGSNLTNLPSQTDNNFTNADHSKLDGIEANATADQTASEILTLIKTVDGTGSGLDADTVDGFTSNKLYREVANASATVGAGWMTVAENTNGRYHGEIFVSDSSSGDHAFIRIDWMRSYMDSCFTVINCGGHGNRITGVRVLRDSDDVYGNKKLQVYVTTNSPYRVAIKRLQNQTGWGEHSVVTPVIQASISGYQVDGSSLENLDTYNFSAEQGIQVGSAGMKSLGNVDITGNITVSGTVDGVDIAALNTTVGTKLPLAGGELTGNLISHSINPDGNNTRSLGTSSLKFHQIHATNFYGGGANLTNVNATTLDSIDSGSFLRSDANDSASGTLSLNGRVNIGNSLSRPAALDSDGDAHCRIGGSDVHLYVASLNESGGYKVAVQAARTSDFASFTLNLQSNGGELQRGGNKVWDAGNDGSGSGLDADTVDGIQASSFLRSDQSDTFNGDLTIGDGTGDTRLLIKKADNNNSDHLQFYNGTTRIGEIGCHDGTWLRINQTTNKNIYTPRYIRADAGFFVDGTSKGINGSGNFIGGTIAGASDYGTLVRSNASDTLTGGTYTFNSATDQRIILQGATNPYIRFQEGTTNKGYIQWNSAGYLRLVNQEDSSQLRVQDDIKFSQDGSTFYSLWHSGNDGSGSGLDADKLDGIQASSFLRSDAADTASAKLTVRDIQIQAGYHLQRSDHHTGHLEGSYNNIGNNSTKTNPIYSIGSNYNPNDDSLNNFYGIGFTHATNASFISKTGAGNWGLYVAADGDARVWLGGDNGVVSSSGQHYVGSNVVWNAGNDGAGSGLDADLLDGVQGTNYAQKTGATCTGDFTFSGGAGAVTIAANSDIRLNNGTWTGESCKIQHHSNRLYLQYPDAGSLICRDSAGNNNLTLDSSGNLTAVGDVTAYSDINLKTNIKTIDNALNMCNQMRGVFFDWKASGDSSIGVIAQEIEKVIPQIVHTNENTDPLTGVVETIKSVDYGKVTSVLINAINELTQKVKELENKLNVE